MNNGLKLIISLAIPQVVGFTGAWITQTGEGSWYQQIRKPEWTPPGWVFGPVWTALYILMGIALFLIWKDETHKARKRTAIAFWTLQMALNFLWSLLFFGMENIAAALLEILALWLFIFLTILSFGRISSTASWLMVPYLAWVSFAVLLNHSIWMLNR